MFLLDTNVISELRRPERANRNVVAWAASIPLANFFLSAISILEIEIGVLRLARNDPGQAAVFRSWIDGQVRIRFAGRILPVDVEVARRCAPLHVPDPRSERDSLIAATALAHGLTMVTRNTAHFATTGVALLNPWDHPAD
jgi:predicted nucleic acid-binding protein